MGEMQSQYRPLVRVLPVQDGADTATVLHQTPGELTTECLLLGRGARQQRCDLGRLVYRRYPLSQVCSPSADEKVRGRDYRRR